MEPGCDKSCRRPNRCRTAVAGREIHRAARHQASDARAAGLCRRSPRHAPNQAGLGWVDLVSGDEGTPSGRWQHSASPVRAARHRHRAPQDRLQESGPITPARHAALAHPHAHDVRLHGKNHDMDSLDMGAGTGASHAMRCRCARICIRCTGRVRRGGRATLCQRTTEGRTWRTSPRLRSRCR